jgi:hypothetical protein
MILKKFAAMTKTQFSISFVDGHLSALEGLFQNSGGQQSNLIDDAQLFLKQWADLFAIPVKNLGPGQIVKSRIRNRIEIFFTIVSDKFQWLESGVSVVFDNKGRLCSIRAQLPKTNNSTPLDGGDPKQARAIFEKTIWNQDNKALLPEPKPVVIEPEWLGKKGPPQLVYEFTVPTEGGSGSVLVNVVGDADTFIPIGSRPEGLPNLTPTPAYHINPHTNCPDFVYFGHPGCMLPEVVTKDSVKVALALFLRYSYAIQNYLELGIQTINLSMNKP